jgi:hypothetical protein
MSHVRHRFAEPLPQPRPRVADLISLLRTAHPDIRVRDALEGLDRLERRRPDHVPGRGYLALKAAGVAPPEHFKAVINDRWTPPPKSPPVPEDQRPGRLFDEIDDDDDDNPHDPEQDEGANEIG